MALPATGLGLTAAGVLVWIAGVPRGERDRVTLTIAVALALLTTAALQQLLVCMLGRAGMASVELLQAGGLALLLCAVVGEVAGRRRRAPVRR